MFTVGLPGREAVVFLDRMHIDDETVKQIAAMAAHPAIHHARVMPDAHHGNGCCVGFTCRLGTTILPNLIGGDIGCGVALHPLPPSVVGHKKFLKRVDEAVTSCVPMGNGHDRVHAAPVIAPEQYEPFYAEAQATAAAFVEAFEKAHGISFSAYLPTYSAEWAAALAARVGSDAAFDAVAMGTLGGGNHFVEVDQDETGAAWLSVHTGSRNLGHNISAYHCSVAAAAAAAAAKSRVPASVPPVAQTTLSTTTDAEASPEAATGAGVSLAVASTLAPPLPVPPRRRSDDEDVIGIRPGAAPGLTGAAAAAYCFDMIYAQAWAAMNRRAILSGVLARLRAPFTGAAVLESVHNYIDFADLVVRKGAVAARAGQPCVVALNSRDGLLLCAGRGNAEWNCSAPHGCGRVLSRTAAAAARSRGPADLRAAMRRFAAEMAGVHSSCIAPETLDERPSAYRDAALIRAALADTADVTCAARTIFNAKGGC